jgi:hypothetical protein
MANPRKYSSTIQTTKQIRPLTKLVLNTSHRVRRIVFNQNNEPETALIALHLTGVVFVQSAWLMLVFAFGTFDHGIMVADWKMNAIVSWVDFWRIFIFWVDEMVDEEGYPWHQISGRVPGIFAFILRELSFCRPSFIALPALIEFIDPQNHRHRRWQRIQNDHSPP